MYLQNNLNVDKLTGCTDLVPLFFRCPA